MVCLTNLFARENADNGVQHRQGILWGPRQRGSRFDGGGCQEKGRKVGSRREGHSGGGLDWAIAACMPSCHTVFHGSATTPHANATMNKPLILAEWHVVRIRHTRSNSYVFCLKWKGVGWESQKAESAWRHR